MFSRILKIFRTFSEIERWIFAAALLGLFLSALFIIINFVNQKTVLVPIPGGDYTEGEVGQPISINPVLSLLDDVDRDLTKIVFSDLSQLAESYKLSGDGKIWNIRLKGNLFWHDGAPILSNDVIFTIKTIQDSDSNSPFYSVWQGVVPERVSERELKLTLPAPYIFFKDILKDLRPIPKHLFESIPVANFRISNYNLEPVGSGPFKFVSMKKKRDGFITEYQFQRNDKYFGDKPYLDRLIFRFYKNDTDLISAFNAGAIDGMAESNEQALKDIKINSRIFEIKMPRYYAVFFNSNSNQALKDASVRRAMDYAVDKRAIINKVFDGLAMIANGPLIPGMEGYAPRVYSSDVFSLENTNKLLDDNNWKLNSDGVREKVLGGTPVKLEFSLVVPHVSFLTESAEMIRDDFSKAGIKLNLVVSDNIDEKIKTRNYDMILFGNIFGNNPDLFSFWRSSERFYPGLNLALYNNKNADSLIDSIRKNFDDGKRLKSLTDLQSVIVNDAPAVFLFSPDYFYIAKTRLGGFEEKFIPLASDRFQNIEKWYVKRARVFK